MGSVRSERVRLLLGALGKANSKTWCVFHGPSTRKKKKGRRNNREEEEERIREIIITEEEEAEEENKTTGHRAPHTRRSMSPSFWS